MQKCPIGRFHNLIAVIVISVRALLRFITPHLLVHVDILLILYEAVALDGHPGTLNRLEHGKQSVRGRRCFNTIVMFGISDYTSLWLRQHGSRFTGTLGF